MLTFTGNPNEKKEFELIKQGEYEFELTLEWAKKLNGEKYINCIYTIRKDMPQEFSGRRILDGIYFENGQAFNNNELELKAGSYDKINSLLSVLPNVKKEFENFDDLIQSLNGAKFIATVEIDPANQFHSKDKNIIKYKSYKKTNDISYGNDVEVRHNVEKEDLPF